LGGLEREGFLDAEFAGQDVAVERDSTLVGRAIVGVGHLKDSAVTFFEIAMNWHSILLGFTIAAGNSGTGGWRAYLIDNERNTFVGGA